MRSGHRGGPGRSEIASRHNKGRSHKCLSLSGAEEVYQLSYRSLFFCAFYSYKGFLVYLVLVHSGPSRRLPTHTQQHRRVNLYRPGWGSSQSPSSLGTPRQVSRPLTRKASPSLCPNPPPRVHRPTPLKYSSGPPTKCYHRGGTCWSVADPTLPRLVPCRYTCERTERPNKSSPRVRTGGIKIENA